MSLKGHLLLNRTLLPPAGEWTAPQAPWIMISVEQGMAYWIGSASHQELGEGDAFLLSEISRGLVRASQLAEVQLAHFTVNPDVLGGFLTLAERHLLNAPQTKIQGLPQHFPARHGVAAEFGRICESLDDRLPLLQRCLLLQLFAAAMRHRLSHLPNQPAGGQAEKRFRDLVASLSEQEIMHFSPRELAHRCGCSPRHFARLFHTHFNCSVREKLTELRLRKARELLLLSQSTVGDVAMATGFRHLGVFNSAFKKHFGDTPRRWRDRHRSAAPQ